MISCKCKMCGGQIHYELNQSIAVCEYCGTEQTIVCADDLKQINLHNRANSLRIANEFDKALSIYESILIDNPKDAEAHWGICLCKYGIEYVDDPETNKKIPTCHRTVYTSIFDDIDYKEAITNCDVIAKRIYQTEADTINKIQKNILSITQKEEPYDIFICYKESDENGNRTKDSVIAQEIYYALTEKGYKVFFSRITLEEKLGNQYEPIIFAALNSAKVMLVLGTKPEYFNAPWVKNEWGRYLSFMKEQRGKYLIPCYKDIQAYDMPYEFLSLQAQDINKLGFLQDLLRGIDKIFERTVNNSVSNTHTHNQVDNLSINKNISNLLKRAKLSIEFGEYGKAKQVIEEVLNENVECAQAYVMLILIEKSLNKEEDLMNLSEPLDQNKNYIKALRFAEDEYKKKIEEYNKKIKEKIKQVKKERYLVPYIEDGILYIEFGKYPQRIVKDNNILCELSSIKVKDELGYTKFEEEEYKYYNGNYYLVEPIKWRVLNENNGKYHLLSEQILDVRSFLPFPQNQSKRRINNKVVHENNYEFSDVRAWLNGYNGSNYDVEDYTSKGFIDIAFNQKERIFIKEKRISNSTINIEYEDTLDKVSLLSMKDLNMERKGYCKCDITETEPTDYAVRDYEDDEKEEFNWWLRTSNDNKYVSGVFGVNLDEYVDDAPPGCNYGVRMSIEIAFNDDVIDNRIHESFQDNNTKTIDLLELDDKYSNQDEVYVHFGRYPQRLVMDSAIISALKSITITNKLGYIELNGKEYKKDNDKYYLVEPICWKVFSFYNGAYEMISELILDFQPFYSLDDTRLINNTSIYPNNYEFSNVRAWLNGYNGTRYDVLDYTNNGFINIAFSEEEQKLIKAEKDFDFLDSHSMDKLYLMRFSDVTEGWPAECSEDDWDDKPLSIPYEEFLNHVASDKLSKYIGNAVCSDYAFRNKEDKNSADKWWTRTPKEQMYVHSITNNEKYPLSYNDADNTDIGVRIVLNLSIINNSLNDENNSTNGKGKVKKNFVSKLVEKLLSLIYE